MTSSWNRRRFLAAAGAGTLVAAARPLAAQGRSQIVISQPADATTMDPGRSTQVLTVNYFANLYDTLTRWDNALKLQPALATAWKAVNETTWDVTLRAGREVPRRLAADGRGRQGHATTATSPPARRSSPPASRRSSPCRCRGPTTLRMVTKKPDPLIPVRMAQMGGTIYPARLTTDEGVKELARKPVGTGAYRFVEWVKDDRLVMDANREWWGWDGKPPAVDRVIWKPIPDDFARLVGAAAGRGGRHHQRAARPQMKTCTRSRCRPPAPWPSR